MKKPMNLETFLFNSSRAHFWNQDEKDLLKFREFEPELTDGETLYTQDECAKITEEAGYRHCYFFTFDESPWEQETE